MVDAWVKQVLENGSRNYIAIYNLNFTATTPLTGYVAADPTSSGDMGVSIGGNTLYPGTHLKIWKMEYDMSASQALKVTWDATTDDIAITVNGNGSGIKDFKKDPGGLYNPKSSGVTGKVLFDTVGTPAVGDFVSIKVWYKKDIAQ
jgi:hypothetical protein